MNRSLSKEEIFSTLKSASKDLRSSQQSALDVVPTGIIPFDSSIDGIPRGVITEISGSISSGRTSLFHSTLAAFTEIGEVCAVIDTNDAFDPFSAKLSGVGLEQILWVRCSSNLEKAFKAADLIVNGGGFGMVVLDIGDMPSDVASRIVSSWWYRFRRSLESTQTAFMVITQIPCVKSASGLSISLSREKSSWTNTFKENEHGMSHPISYILREADVRVERKRPLHMNHFQPLFSTAVPYGEFNLSRVRN